MKKAIPIYNIKSVSEFKRDDILVSRFASYAASRTHLHSPHKHDFFHVVLFTSGSGQHSVDFQTFPVKPFQIYFMIPGQVHSWNFKNEPDGYIVNFSAQFFQSFLLRPDYLDDFPFFSGSVKSAVLDIPEKYRVKIVDLFEELLQEGGEQNQIDTDYIRILLLHMFGLIEKFAPAPVRSTASTYNYTLLKNFQKLIEDNYTTFRLPKEYAQLLYITPNHLNALCNDMLGISAGEMIRNRTILEAKRLLINLHLSISEISSLLNFADNSYFTKFFKKQVGSTPEEFRKRMLSEHRNTHS